MPGAGPSAAASKRYVGLTGNVALRAFAVIPILRLLLRGRCPAVPAVPAVPALPALLPIMTLKDMPDHHDAELVLKLYELRREAVMRESRAQIIMQFHPKSFDDVLAITKGDHPLNAAFRQVSTFWEMAYSMAKHGAIHGEFMMESCGEGLLLFSRIEPWLGDYRAQVSPVGFRNAEWVATNTDTGRGAAERFRKRMQATLDASK
jgi:hypothetical protein